MIQVLKVPHPPPAGCHLLLQESSDSREELYEGLTDSARPSAELTLGPSIELWQSLLGWERGTR